MVKDSLLKQHLSHWGIDIMKQEKYEKTMQELEIEYNKNYMYKFILESNEQLVCSNVQKFCILRVFGEA